MVVVPSAEARLDMPKAHMVVVRREGRYQYHCGISLG